MLDKSPSLPCVSTTPAFDNTPLSIAVSRTSTPCTVAASHGTPLLHTTSQPSSGTHSAHVPRPVVHEPALASATYSGPPLRTQPSSGSECDSDSDSNWSSVSSQIHVPNLPNVSTYPAPDQFMQAVAQAASHAALAAVETTASKAPPQPGSHSQSPAVHLPKLKLPSFSGDILSWPVFWDMFTASVDAQTLPNVSKFTYLKSAVKGPASRLIAGLAVTDQNYPLALQMLQSSGNPTSLSPNSTADSKTCLYLALVDVRSRLRMRRLRTSYYSLKLREKTSADNAW